MDIETYIQNLIAKNIIPGISILVGKGEQVLYKGVYGCKAVKPGQEPLPKNENTIYDLASLTKPLITAFSVVYLIEKNEISLDTSIRKFFPYLDFGGGPEMKVVHLLSHTSGLPAWYPFYLYGQDYLDQFKTMRLETKPGRKVEYSCTGYILLHYLVEKVTAAPFREFIEELILKPLRLSNTYLRVPFPLIEKTAPTEEGTLYEQEMAAKTHGPVARKFQWRTTVIRGETHDCNSYYLGGTAGNAGLFSTVDDIFRLSLEFFPSTASILQPASTRIFWKNLTPFKKSHRTAGFKLNSSIITSGGKALSRSAAGHCGFTGTSLWLESHDEMKYIVLSNRIHPHFNAINFNKIRRKIHYYLKKHLVTRGQ